ncbi:MAG: ATP-binding protein [Candidatus Thorarchaeota archaeon]
MNQYSSFLKPSDLSLVVGRQEHQSRFETLLTRFIAGDLERNLIIISGSPGMGKSTLLGLYRKIAGQKKIAYIQPTIRMGEKSQDLFREIYKALSPNLEPEKKAFLKKAKEIQIGFVVSNQTSSDITSGFLNNLQVRPPARPIIIAFDPVDRILDTNNYIFEVLKDLIKSLRGKFPLFFIVVVQKYNSYRIKEFLRMGEHITVDSLNFDDSKFLLSKLSYGPPRTSEHLIEVFLKRSDRSPFNLVFISEVIAWVKEKIKIEGLDEKEALINELAQPFVKNFALRAFIQEIFDISKDEDKAIQIMLNSPQNAVNRESLIPMISKKTLEKLLKKALVISQGDYYQFSSYALYHFLGLGTRVVNRTTEIELLLKVLEDDIRQEFAINPTVLERLEQIALTTAYLEDSSIPVRAKTLYDIAIDQKKYYTAFRLALLIGNLFRIAKDGYGSGHFLEECAQNLYFLDKVQYATILFDRALEAYRFADRKKEFLEIAQKSASVYLKQAEQYKDKNQIGLARASFYHSIQLFRQANDYDSAREAGNKVIQTYEKSVHQKYFKKLLPSIKL